MNANSKHRHRNVFISGAGGGLGRALVHEFYGLGFHVIAADIDQSKLSAFVGIGGITCVHLDVTDSNAVGKACKDLLPGDSGLDILVSQAGIYDTFPLTEENPELFRHIMEINLFGTVNLIHNLLRPLIRQKGRVIVVSSESYKVQALFQPYMISKAALEAYCLTARQELALKGVKLSVIRPGAMKTPLLNWMKNPPDPGKFPLFEKELLASWNQSSKIVGKVITPETVAKLVAKASLTSHPKRNYRINNSLTVKLVALLPKALLDKLVYMKFREKKH
jgi:NAD(P)-dependent dehydrogenase (short-subunit alcohol dehydrogenase family)